MCVIWSIKSLLHLFVHKSSTPSEAPEDRTVSLGASPVFIMPACIKEGRKEPAYRHYPKLLCCSFQFYDLSLVKTWIVSSLSTATVIFLADIESSAHCIYAKNYILEGVK